MAAVPGWLRMRTEAHQGGVSGEPSGNPGGRTGKEMSRSVFDPGRGAG